MSIIKAMRESELKWRELDIKLLAKFAGITQSTETILKYRLEEVIQTPKTKTSFNSFAIPNKVVKESNQENQFRPAKRNPNEMEIKTMLALIVAHIVTQCMGNHFYKIGIEIK